MPKHKTKDPVLDAHWIPEDEIRLLTTCLQTKTALTALTSTPPPGQDHAELLTTILAEHRDTWDVQQDVFSKVYVAQLRLKLIPIFRRVEALEAENAQLKRQIAAGAK